MLDSGSKGEKIFIYSIIIIGILVFGALIYHNFFKDPIIGDWECITSATYDKPTGLGYHFYDNGSYTLYIIFAGENSDYSSGTWSQINDGYYELYSKTGKVNGYITYDNDWLYEDEYAFHRINN